MAKAHIDNWINKAEPDYYTMFIKAWIPFNAWYFNEYSTTKDSVALEKVRNTSNKIRNRIVALIQNQDNEAKNFRYNLGQLHFQLESRTIINYGKNVSFEKITLEGFIPQATTDTDRKGNIYKAIPNLTTGYKAIIIDKNNRTIFDKTFNPYSMTNFLLENQYISLPNDGIKEKIRICFANINPEKAISLISKSKIKSEFIVLDADSKIHFINDTETIAKALLQILYTLRCLLFHGTLDPTETNHPIYEHAFNILKPIIKELK